MAGPHPGVSRVHQQAPAGDDEAEPTFVYEADFHIGGHPGLNYNSIYVGPLHPWLTSIERSDGMLHPFGLSEDAFEGRLAPVKAWLDGGGHVDSYTETLGSTLLVSVASARHMTAQHLELMRYLISLGADVNRLDWQGDWNPLCMCVCAQSGAVKRGPLPRPRVLEGYLTSIVRPPSCRPCSSAEKKTGDSEKKKSERNL